MYSLRYTDNMPDWQGAYARMWMIRIRPRYNDDRGILEHEIFHVRNWWINTLVALAVVAMLFTVAVHFGAPTSLFGLLPLAGLADTIFYKIRRFRLWEEVEAYKIQLQHPPASLDRERYIRQYFAPALSEKYRLDISVEEAVTLLTPQNS